LGCKGTQLEKEKFIFDLYDLNGHGSITREEIITILHNIKPTFSTSQKDKLHIAALKKNNEHCKSVDSIESPKSEKD